MAVHQASGVKAFALATSSPDRHVLVPLTHVSSDQSVDRPGLNNSASGFQRQITPGRPPVPVWCELAQCPQIGESASQFRGISQHQIMLVSASY